MTTIDRITPLIYALAANHDEITAETHLKNDLELACMDLIELSLELEEEFDIDLEGLDEVGNTLADKWKTVADVVASVEELL